MPGFVDTHTHYGDPGKNPDADYINKLWLAAGVTTVRGVPAGACACSPTAITARYREPPKKKVRLVIARLLK